MIDDEDDVGVEDLDEVAREERKLEYGRQKTKDIGFDLPLDDDGEYEEPVEDEFEDEEDDEAQPITAGGKKLGARSERRGSCGDGRPSADADGRDVGRQDAAGSHQSRPCHSSGRARRSRR